MQRHPVVAVTVAIFAVVVAVILLSRCGHGDTWKVPAEGRSSDCSESDARVWTCTRTAAPAGQVITLELSPSSHGAVVRQVVLSSPSNKVARIQYGFDDKARTRIVQDVEPGTQVVETRIGDIAATTATITVLRYRDVADGDPVTVGRFDVVGVNPSADS